MKLPSAVLSAIPSRNSRVGWVSDSLIVYSVGNIVSFWNPFDISEKFRFASGISGSVDALGASKDGQYLAICSHADADGAICIIDVASRQAIASAPTSGRVLSVAFSDDGYYLAICNNKDGRARLSIIDWTHGLRLVASTVLTEASLPLSRAVTGQKTVSAKIAFIPLQNQIAVFLHTQSGASHVSSDLQTWTLAHDTLRLETQRSHTVSFHHIMDMSVSPSTGLIYTATSDKLTALDSTGQLIGHTTVDRLHLPAPITSVACGHDLLIVSCEDGALACLDPASFALLGVTPSVAAFSCVIQAPVVLTSGQSVAERMRPRLMSQFIAIRSIQVSPSGSHVLLCTDRSIAVVDIAKTNIIDIIFNSPPDVSSTAIMAGTDPRGDVLAQGTGSGLVYMWREVGSALVPSVIDVGRLIDASLDPTAENGPFAVTAVEVCDAGVTAATRNGFVVRLSPDLRSVHTISATGAASGPIMFISPVFNNLCATATSQSLTVRDATTMRTVSTAPLPVASRLRPSITMASSGLFIISSGGPGVALFRLSTDHTAVTSVGGVDVPGGCVADVALHPSGAYVALLCDNGYVHLIHLATMSLRGALSVGLPPLVNPAASCRYSVTFDPSGLYLIVTGGPLIRPIVNIFETGTGDFIGTLPVNVNLTSIGFTPTPAPTLVIQSGDSLTMVDLPGPMKANIAGVLGTGLALSAIWDRYPLYLPDRVVAPSLPHQHVPSTNVMVFTSKPEPTSDTTAGLSGERPLVVPPASLGQGVPVTNDLGLSGLALQDGIPLTGAKEEEAGVGSMVSSVIEGGEGEVGSTTPTPKTATHPTLPTLPTPDASPAVTEPPLPVPPRDAIDPTLHSTLEHPTEPAPARPMVDLVATVMPDPTRFPPRPADQFKATEDDDDTGWDPGSHVTVTNVTHGGQYIEKDDGEYHAEPVDGDSASVDGVGITEAEETVVTLGPRDLGMESTKDEAQDRSSTLRVTMALDAFETRLGLTSEVSSVAPKSEAGEDLVEEEMEVE